MSGLDCLEVARQEFLSTLMEAIEMVGDSEYNPEPGIFYNNLRKLIIDQYGIDVYVKLQTEAILRLE